ncbi:MAG: hypothetical protein V2I41_03890 [Pseudomonadales bacterium]|jgi:hypothetical protein|nr:hypothetical protein [Pseudomonadales bacterium]
MNNYLVTAKNYSEDSENRIHSDEIAQKFGFRGALVPGVAVYGYMTHPLVEKFGEDWLARANIQLRLLKPTYDGEQMTITCNNQDGQIEVVSHDPEGQLTAVLLSQSVNKTSDETVPMHDLALLDGPLKHPDRVAIGWDTVNESEVFSPWEFHLSTEENARYTNEVADTLDIYQAGYVHPHLLLSLANTALMNEYVMPTWIHASSHIVHHQALRQEDTITIRSVTTEKWQKKGHEFIRIWVTYWLDGVLTTEIDHTAIFKVAT